MKGLLRLYPREWRRRYQVEMEALLEETTPSIGAAWDLILGALEAHLSQGSDRKGRIPQIGTGQSLAIAVLVGTAGSWLLLGWVAGLTTDSVPGRDWVNLGSPNIDVRQPHSIHLAPAVLVCAGVILAAISVVQKRWLIATMAGLGAARFAADLLLLPSLVPVSYGVLHWVMGSFRARFAVLGTYEVGIAIGVVTTYTIASTLLLWRRLGLVAALGFGLVLELLLGRPDVVVIAAENLWFTSLPTALGLLLPNVNELAWIEYLLGSVVWAAIVSWILTRGPEHAPTPESGTGAPELDSMRSALAG